MKIRITYLFFLLPIKLCFGQFFISSNSEIHVNNGRTLYFDKTVNNEGLINFETVGELTLDQGLDNSEGTLTLNDAILKLGSGTPNADGIHTLTFNDSDDTIKFMELNHNGTFNVSSTGFLNILDTFISKSGTLNASDRIVLISSSAQNTAIVPQSQDGNINSIRVERFYPANRAWRFLSSPVNSISSIFDNWQYGGFFVPNKGTHITGGSVANGFDQNESGNPSLYTFNNTTTSWDTFANTNATNLVAGQNYYTLVRGDRSIDLMINDFDTEVETVLYSTGALHIGDFDTNHNVSSGGFIATGNPYQSPVDLSLVRTESGNSFTDEMWIWQPEANNSGQYAYIVPSTGINSLPGSNADQYLQPSQAVFIQAAIDNPQINYREAHKGNSNNLIEVFSNQIDNFLRIGLYDTNDIPFIDIANDGLIMLMDSNYDTLTTIEDGEKFFNNDENIAIQYGNQLLTADKRNVPTDLNEVVELFINNIDSANYNFSIEMQGFGNLPNGLYLWDKYNDTYTPLSDGLIIPIQFDLAIPESVDNNRFALTFDIQTLDTNTVSEAYSIGVYPNAFKDVLYITFGQNLIGKNAMLKIYDALGKTVYNNNLKHIKDKIQLNNLSLNSGVYFLNISNENINHTFKLIRE